MSDSNSSNEKSIRSNNDGPAKSNDFPSPLTAFLENRFDGNYSKFRNITLITAAFLSLLGLTGKVTRTIFGDISFPAGEAKELFFGAAFIALVWILYSLFQAAKESLGRWEAKWKNAEDAIERFFFASYPELGESIKKQLENKQTSNDFAEIELLSQELAKLDSRDDSPSSAGGSRMTLEQVHSERSRIEEEIDTCKARIADVERTSLEVLAARAGSENGIGRAERRILMRNAVSDVLAESNRNLYSATALAFEKLSLFREYLEFSTVRDAYLRQWQWVRYIGPLLVSGLAALSLFLLAEYKHAESSPPPDLAEVIQSESRIWRLTISDLLAQKTPDQNVVVWSAQPQGDLTLAFPVFAKWDDEKVTFGEEGGVAQFGSFVGGFVEQIANCAKPDDSSPIKAVDIELVGYADSKVKDSEDPQSLLKNLRLADSRATNFESTLKSQLNEAAFPYVSSQDGNDENTKVIVRVWKWAEDIKVGQHDTIRQRHIEMRAQSGFSDYQSEPLGRFSRRVDLIVRSAGYCDSGSMLRTVSRSQ